MKTRKSLGAMLVVMMLGGPASTRAAEKVDIGKTEYDSNCVRRHGDNLTGAAYIDFLKATPPDLTLLTTNNGGASRFERVYELIDARQEVKPHELPDMPQ